MWEKKIERRGEINGKKEHMNRAKCDVAERRRIGERVRKKRIIKKCLENERGRELSWKKNVDENMKKMNWMKNKEKVEEKSGKEEKRRDLKNGEYKKK